ncbi:TonB-dependent receptor plug domain-containing protein [Thiohalocapsa marina]|uniref:TonB-dependent receptor plug domain-containing protein n=1 Tax=Thiohalocapsa marina TaxID=424902 RepID=A0A5M8FLV7_9GAMM|nr:TonB-dependent receptor [Thiohalocapsa marina]KAA6185484.1 TonB-dependent receptor plug domain-containing protein [Thiohalocapsa marina]
MNTPALISPAATRQPVPSPRAAATSALTLIPILTLALITAPALLTSAPARAEDRPPPAGTELDYLADIPVVVSATRLAQRVTDTPTAVTVIDRELIQQSGAIHLVDLLRLVPGFQVAHVSGNLFTATAHGASPPWFSRLQVLIDGQSRYYSTFSGLDWANLGIALADVERIEVVRGANIPTYGDNAISGTVNIITRQPFQDQGLFLQASGGSRDWAQGLVRYAGRLGNMDYRLTLEHRQDDGFADVHDHTRLFNPSFRGIVDLTPQDELDIHLSYTASDLGSDLQLPDYPRDDRTLQSDFQFLRWTHADGSDRSFYLQFTRDAYDSHEDTHITLGELAEDLGLPPAITEYLGPLDQALRYNSYNSASERYEVEFQQSLRLFDTARLAWGGSYRWDRLRHDHLGSDDWVSAERARLSGNLEWRPALRIVANIGAALESNTVTEGQAFSPRIGVNVRLAPNQTARIALTRAHKFPSLLEEHWNEVLATDDGTVLFQKTRSDGDLALETRDQVELGYLAEFWRGALSLDTRLYHERIEDAVDTTFDRNCPEQPFVDEIPCLRIQNAMDYRVTGLEASATLRPRAGTLARLTYAYADARNRSPDMPDSLSAVSPVDTIPRHSGSLLLSQTFGQGFEGSVAAYYMDDLIWSIYDRSPHEPLKDHLRIDLRLAKRFGGNTRAGLVELLVHGLGGGYDEFFLDNRFEPRVYLRASLQFR